MLFPIKGSPRVHKKKINRQRLESKITALRMRLGQELLSTLRKRNELTGLKMIVTVRALYICYSSVVMVSTCTYSIGKSTYVHN